MTGKHDRAFARRRGTSVAACALGMSLVVTGLQPVATPQAASQASAQLSGKTEADKSLVRYPRGSTTVRYGETTSISPNTNALTVHPPTGYKLAEGVNPGWGVEVDPKTGELSITPDTNAELPETDTINVEFTFVDESTKVVGAEVSLQPAPVYVDQSDKVYWTGKEINPVDIRVNRAAYASKLEIDESTLPPGITATLRNFGNIKHIFLKGAPIETGTFTVKTQLMKGGSVVVGANGPLEQSFTITVNDSADLPAPVEENIVADPAPVKPGESVDIDIPTENASSVEVKDLPEGLIYDSEKSKITGTPKTSGKARVDIITNDARVITDTIDIQVEGSGGSTTPETTKPEPTTTTSDQATPEPSTTAPVTTTEPVMTEPTTSGATSEPTTSGEQPTSAATTQPETTEPTTSGASEEPTTEQSTTSEQPSTSAQPSSPGSSTKPSTSGATSKPTTSGQKPTSGATTQPATTQPGTTAPTTEASTPATTTAPATTTEPVTTEPTTSGASGKPTTQQPTTQQPTTKPSTASKPTTQQPSTSAQLSTSAQPSSPGSSTKPSTSGATSKPTTSGQKPTSGATTQPATTQPGTTAPTTEASTPATTTAPATTTEPVTTEPTTSGASGKPTTQQPTTQQPTTKPSTASKPTTQQPSTSAQPIPTAPVPAGDYVWNKLQLQAGSAKFAAPNQKPKQSVGVRIEGDAPEWVSVAADGQLVAEPNRDVAPGVYPINVITDNGERGTILVEVAAPVSDADRVTAEYKESFVQAGRTNSSRRPVATIDRDGVKYAKQPLPAGTTFSVSTANGTVDPETGVVTVNAPLSMAAGETIVVGVDIRYPDGTTEKVTAQFVVDAAEQSEFYHPAYKEGLGAQAGRTVVVPVLEDSVPEDGQYELFPQDRDDDWDVSIDPETGAVTATAPEEGAKDISVPVTVLYSDGTTSDREETDPETGERKKVPTVFAHISAVEGPTLATDSTSGADYGTPFFDADGNIRIFPNGSLPQGATFQQDGLTALPVEVDPNTGAITIKVPQDAPAGANFDIPLKITLPDGSVQEIRVPVATKSEAADQAVAWRPIKVTESGTPTQVKPTAAPAGATYALAASFDTPGWQASVDPVSGAITVNRAGTDEDPQAALVPVVVTFADGSQRVVEVPATAVRGTAALTEVDYPRATVNAGQSATLRPSVSDGTFSLVKTVPGLRTVIDPNTGELTVTSFDSTVPGLREIPVQVTFTDSSHLVTSARVEVKTTSGADTYTEGIKLDDVTVIGRPETTSRYTLPVPPHAADRAFSLGEFSVPGWNVTLDEVNGVLEVQVPAGTRGVRQAIPLNVAFADGTVGTFNAVVEVDNVGVAEGSSQSSTGSSTPSPWVWALAVLGLLGTVCKVLYDNREQVLQFLAGWM